jgi:hypothetical protein
MPRVRFTVRRFMLVVAWIAIGLFLEPWSRHDGGKFDIRAILFAPYLAITIGWSIGAVFDLMDAAPPKAKCTKPLDTFDRGLAPQSETRVDRSRGPALGTGRSRSTWADRRASREATRRPRRRC